MLLKIIRETKHLQALSRPAMGTSRTWGVRHMAQDSTSMVVRFALGSLAVGVVVLALKGVAAWLTGSIALYSDALESVVNVVTAVVALVAVRLAARPADAALPYGYGKAEYFSAVVIGVFIAVAALLIFGEAWRGFTDPHPFRADPLGHRRQRCGDRAEWRVGVLPDSHRDGASAHRRCWRMAGIWRPTWCRRSVCWSACCWRSPPAMRGSTRSSRRWWASTILWSGWRLIRESVIGLMDVAVDPKRLTQIREIIAANAEGAIEAHDIRTRQAGRMIFIEFHLVVAGPMSVEAAHAICDRIEAKLRDAVGEAQITIHVEPEEKAKHSGIVVI